MHVATFDALVERESREGPRHRRVTTVHHVENGLLQTARVAGPGAATVGVRAAVHDLVSRGADLVVCTCSTIGAVAETVGSGPPAVAGTGTPTATRAVPVLELLDGTGIRALASPRPGVRAALRLLTP